jgi:adenylate cyclase
MGADEEGTLGRLKTLRAELGNPKIAEHGGRIVKTTGDGLLLELSSVVGAVRCVVEVQTTMAVRNADLPQNRRIEFRIGVNLGDIIIDGDDIFGDGVKRGGSPSGERQARWYLGVEPRARRRARPARP